MTSTYSLIQRHKSRGNKTWYIHICTDGRDAYKSTKTTIKAEAMRIFADFVNGEKSAASHSADTIDVCCEIDKWLDIQRHKFGEDGRTYNLYAQILYLFKGYLDGRRTRMLPKVTKDVAQGFANKLVMDGRKASTIDLYLRCVRVFYNWLIDNYDLPIRNPMTNIARPKVEHKMVEFWTTEECDAIIDNVDDKHYKAYFALQCYAGLRSFEAKKMLVQDVGEKAIIVRRDKTGCDAQIPMSAKLKAILADEIGDRTEGNLFKEGVINKYANKQNKRLIAAVTMAGLLGRGRVFQHRLRHSFASNLLRGGVDIKSVQTLGRWASPDILLEHYAGVIPDALMDAVNKL